MDLIVSIKGEGGGGGGGGANANVDPTILLFSVAFFKMVPLVWETPIIGSGPVPIQDIHARESPIF